MCVGYRNHDFTPIYRPLTIGLPIALWSIKHKPGMWTRIALQILSMLCLAVTIVAVVGSVQAIVADSITYHVGF